MKKCPIWMSRCQGTGRVRRVPAVARPRGAVGRNSRAPCPGSSPQSLSERTQESVRRTDKRQKNVARCHTCFLQRGGHRWPHLPLLCTDLRCRSQRQRRCRLGVGRVRALSMRRLAAGRLRRNRPRLNLSGQTPNSWRKPQKNAADDTTMHRRSLCVNCNTVRKCTGQPLWLAQRSFNLWFAVWMGSR